MTQAGDEDLAGLADRIADGLREVAPPGSQRLEAWFAMTVVAESAVLVADDGIRSVRCPVPDAVWDAVRRHRQVSARADGGPWWRLLVRIDAEGVEAAADHGAVPFPGEQLFAPEAYLADLERYPRDRLPVWLAAYLGRGERRTRPPRAAADAMRADRRAGLRAVAVDNELPELAVLWARWAVLAAAFVAVGSGQGPRIGPSVGLFEGAGRSGSTLTLLPGDRAVLSGGVWDASILDAAYNTGAAMPELFAGAPDWVADPVLNPRAATGLLSFCYWWEAGQWYRGESAPIPECAPALPAVWTVGTVAAVVGNLLDDRLGGRSDAVELLVSAAQAGAVTREALVQVFGDGIDIDIDGAMFQFVLADLDANHAEGIGEADALDLVRDHIRRQGYDTTGYPLSTLRADRISVGWVVRSPVPDGVIALDRAVFYVADDGVVERSTTSAPLSVFVTGFERRFRLRGNDRA
ncbi:hypothetical protein [Nocardia gipuzkoensis]|uniref:hypothetical protein n=1 Tax=Nocardia gipuzkoensis TaxID=2749991 RepID=UPI00237EE2E8|nr:hypothetical protein [Nocardia gipuzkoensis]MDE1674136.1 hypothetical protein [Nocardia gipuzkoensis]